MSLDKTAADDPPADDPFEAELVAFLDGELDPVAARRVRAKLDADPALRARAAALKKSFDLLDYLPKPEPSPTFATRTLDKLPAAKGSGPQPVPAARPAGVSTSVPVPLDPVSLPLPLPQPAPPARGRVLAWAAGVATAVCACAALGYAAAGALGPRLFPPPEREPEAAAAPVEPRVIEHLPLYAVADDLAFVTELVRPELFGDDPALASDPTLRVPPAAAVDKPGGDELGALARAFRALPPARQAEVVRLDRELHARPAAERERLFRALEAYAAWLARLPEAERRGVLQAATPGLRLGVVRDVRERQWRDALPAAVRAKPELIAQWREDEAARRERWALVRRHADAFAANKSPWPFDTEQGRRDMAEYAKTVLRADDQRHRRLAPDEYARYAQTLAQGEREGVWVWHGLFVYELAQARPHLPEPADPKLMYTDVADLPEAVPKALKKANPPRLRAVTGRWPEFPLEVLQLVPKGAAVPPLGPAKVAEFREPARAFISDKLLPVLAREEARELARLEGQWPQYPQRLVQLAHKHDLAIPGVMLPGSPKKWDATYRLGRDPR